MEGTLLVPPERGTIIGRAVWKPRFIVVASGHKDQQTNPTFSQSVTASRLQAASRASNIRAQPRGSPEAIYISIYKSKGEWEPIQQHALSSVTDCQIQQVAHRKQGPVLPTLIINISPDPTTDKLRKRRSSRTAGLTSTKETHPTTLWFRPGDDKYTLQDWARFIQPLIQPNMPDRAPMSPITPASPSFINPFSARREASDAYQRPASGHANHWGALHHKGSSHTHSSRERPITYSESPSLRSKRSDVSSSHASSMIPAQMGYQNYTAVQQGHAADLPSPATTIGEYQGEFIEGWTSAQGRSSTLSSPIRGRDSISSQGPPQSIVATMDSSSPPAPRETILDRAFQLRCIPGSEREVPGEEKLSSLARFDALMREADERRKIREAEEARLRAESEPKSVWDLDDDSDSDEGEDDDDDSDDVVGELNDSELGYPMPSTAQRALDYIASRHDSQQGQRSRALTGRGPLNYNAETLMALNSGSSLLRPQTSYARNRPGMAQRTHSQPQLAGMGPMPSDLDSATQLAGTRGSGDGTLTAKASPLQRSQTEKRLSTSSAKRASFTEFTKRLSSTSSLLLVQTNASSASAASSRGSSDTAGEGSQQHGLRGALQPRGVRSPTPWTERDGSDKACNWRGSVGVFGAEGGLI